MLALFIDYLIECVYLTVCYYCLDHYTIQYKVIPDTVFCSTYQNTCQLKVPLIVSGIFLLIFITFNVEMCIPRSLATHWDHIFQSVLDHFDVI